MSQGASKSTSKSASKSTPTSAPKGTSASKGATSKSGSTSSGSTSAASARRPAARRTTPRRPQGPGPEDRRRSRYGFLLPEVVTVRTLVVSVVVLLAVVLLLPTVRAYVSQTNELRALRVELADAQAEHDGLESELERWEDRAFVEREARERLNFVMPGERAWRVLDPESVVDDIDPRTGQEITDGPVEGPGDGTPWYEAMWESVEVAGRQPVTGGAAAGSGDNG
ncbi:FtsB family cell division protein [Cellulosimicrobium marinum]|uniref:FtsB family cell division protein n=1 Tax=Cellulosimicrobium marinum TaxID=1638992 RepID=UPI001E2B6FF0|nr:septum formation initiator family protein [Cellulosimicrobium marinum]MCB7137070.1 septum formation initiator family protein [Cellulosimicrobium marinum]